jgi:hypothetical protein
MKAQKVPSAELQIAADHAAFGGIAISLFLGPHVG